MNKPCNCEVHLHVEAEEPKKPHIPCVGHGEGCPCTEKLKNLPKFIQDEKAKNKSTD
jgi:hypothetical protein